MTLGTKNEDFGYNCIQSVSTKIKPSSNSLLKLSYKKPKGKKRAKKGVVTIQVLTNTTRFKYRYNGKVFYLTIPAKNFIQPEKLENLRIRIEADIAEEKHDDTQQAYKQELLQQNIADFSKQPVYSSLINASPEGEVSLFERLIEWSELTNRTKDKPIYCYTFAMVEKWIKEGKKVTVETLSTRLREMNYAAATFNTRKFVLNLFCSWQVKKGLTAMNPFDDVPPMKMSKAKDPKRQRLDDYEVSKILQAIKDDTFLLPNHRGYTHSHYYPIFTFLAYTGCRPAEAIGLLVKKVDLKSQTVKIDAAFARTMKGSSHACRIMKSTKTTEERTLSFHDNCILKEILEGQCHGRKLDDFVFPSPNGLCCYDRALNDTVLKTVLDGLGIPDRVLYVFRHSFISRCFQQGMDIKKVQSLSGHRDLNVLLNIYAEVSNVKVSVPNLITGTL